MRDLANPSTRDIGDFSGRAIQQPSSRSISDDNGEMRDVGGYEEDGDYPYTYPFYYHGDLSIRDLSNVV